MPTLHRSVARPPASHRPARRSPTRHRKPCMTPAEPTLALADWDLLYQAVLARLTDAVAAAPASQHDLAAARAAADRVQATVLECVESLAHLRTLLPPQRQGAVFSP